MAKNYSTKGKSLDKRKLNKNDWKKEAKEISEKTRERVG